jgi:hypothetical protein
MYRIRFSAYGVAVTATKADWLEFAATQSMEVDETHGARASAFTKTLLNALHVYANEHPVEWVACLTDASTGYRAAINLFQLEAVRVMPA